MGLMLGVWVFFLLFFNRRYARSRRFRLGCLVGIMFNLIADGFTHDPHGRHKHNDEAPQGATSSGSS